MNPWAFSRMQSLICSRPAFGRAASRCVLVQRETDFQGFRLTDSIASQAASPEPEQRRGDVAWRRCLRCSRAASRFPVPGFPDLLLSAFQHRGGRDIPERTVKAYLVVQVGFTVLHLGMLLILLGRAVLDQVPRGVVGL